MRSASKPPSASALIVLQIALLAEREMHALVEVFACLAIVPDHFVGDDAAQKAAKVVLEGPILGRQLDAGELHLFALP